MNRSKNCNLKLVLLPSTAYSFQQAFNPTSSSEQHLVLVQGRVSPWPVLHCLKGDGAKTTQAWPG